MAFYTKFIKDIISACTRWMIGHHTHYRLGKKCYHLKSYIASIRRRKTDLHVWASISAFEEVWLIHNAGGLGGDPNFSCLALK